MSDGEWIGIEGTRGKIKSKARFKLELRKGVIALSLDKCATYVEKDEEPPCFFVRPCKAL